jgi:hypothetical protein
MVGLSRSSMVALLAVALFSLASAGVVVGFTADGSSAPPEIVSATNSTNYVVPDRANVTRQEYEQADLDIASVMAADTERIQGQYNERYYQWIQETESEEAAKTAISQQIGQRVERLERRQQRLFDDYSSGTLSSETLVRELARLEIAAQGHRSHIDQFFEDRTGDTPSGLLVETAMLRNPVSEQLVDALSTRQESVSVYVVAAPDSLAAATVVEDTYHRQATLRAERDPAGTDQFAEGDEGRAQAAGSRAQSLYSEQIDTVRGFSGTNLYEFRMNHSHGELVGYLDGSTTNPVHEYQYKRPVVSVPAETTSSTGDSFRLNVQYTDATGPMAVTLLGTGSDVPPTVDLTIDGQYVGTIDQSGQLWTIQPLGSFTVTATTEDGETVSVTVPGTRR